MSILSGELDRFFVAENADSLFQLLHLERLFQNSDRPFGQNPVKHRAVRIAGNDDDRTVRLIFLDRVVNVVGRTVGQFQIEKYEIEFLFSERSQSFSNRPDHDAAETDFAEEKFEKILQAFVIVHDQNGGLTGFFLLENVFIQGGLFDAPATADLDGWELTALNEIIHRRQRDPEIFGGF